MSKTLSKDKIDMMIDLRKQGHSYVQIEKIVGVSRYSTISYLKDIPIDNGLKRDAWKEIEDQGMQYLADKGFSNIINLNEISNQNSSWDYYGTKDGKEYLFDTTIDDRKPITKKIESLKNGYIGIILYYSFSKEEFIPYQICKVDL